MHEYCDGCGESFNINDLVYVYTINYENVFYEFDSYFCSDCYNHDMYDKVEEKLTIDKPYLKICKRVTSLRIKKS